MRSWSWVPVLFLLGSPVFAQTAGDSHSTDEQKLARLEARLTRLEAALAEAETSGLHWSGYGVINFYALDTFENVQDDTPTLRGRADVERIIFAPRYQFDEGVAFVAEIEIEHGGVGTTVEYEPEEFGEYETEIEHGGEIVLEQAHLLIEQSAAVNWRLGHMVVPVGMLNSHHEPTQYFTTRRSPAEAALLPNVWHATGVELFGVLGRVKYQLQLVNALDSTGFSGYGWVSGGQRQLLEYAPASALAFVARADVAITLGLTVGGSLYIGDSAANRTVDNMTVDAMVRITEVHMRYADGPWIVRAEYLLGDLNNAAAVSQANQNVFNAGALGISATSVGAEAEAAFVAVGFDLLSLFTGKQQRLDLFVRYDQFDTATGNSIANLPRYEHQIISTGLNYHWRPGIVFKGEIAHETHAGSVGESADYAAIGIGFEF